MEDCAEKRLQCGPAGGDQHKAGPVLLAAGVGEGRAEAGVRQPRAVAGGGLAGRSTAPPAAGSPRCSGCSLGGGSCLEALGRVVAGHRKTEVV